ncbi:MAG: PAS domain-containing protein [Parvibaculum sp.]|uniref:PAS domain-containing protein n=1 Tax=Parvibaculum sp. TaxID=2024848 RepID=UPI0027276578|nr:PAS domain-containing protein [Parvibaculum sp.]MDO8840465.1 PAS domain-containing protein [Parvibaculum sp.]
MAAGVETHQTGESGIDYDVVEAAEPEHPKCRFMLDYWRARCQPDGMPLRRDFNPLDMPKLMGGMFVVEPVDGGTDMRYRLIGAANVRRLGMPFTGRLFSECYAPPMAASQIVLHNRVMNDRKPAVLRGRFVGVDLEYIQLEAIYLPVAADTGFQVIGGLYDMALLD